MEKIRLIKWPVAFFDVPRLINNTEVKDEHGVLFEKPANDATSRGREMLIKSFLEVLITKLRISDAENIMSRYVVFNFVSYCLK